ncbi:MAG: hypothetical protein L0H55_16415, partial [Candidatus Nitrosocosmicus sp.]|nr:hypothetical protein [Candidatus Nitrosocosmicus sp.]
TSMFSFIVRKEYSMVKCTFYCGHFYKKNNCCIKSKTGGVCGIDDISVFLEFHLGFGILSKAIDDHLFVRFHYEINLCFSFLMTSKFV